MEDSELVRRVLSLSPTEVQKIKSQLGKQNNKVKPKKERLTSSKGEEVSHRRVEDCGNCSRASVHQSSEDYHILENSCVHVRTKKYNEDRRLYTCEWWSMKRKVKSSEGEEED